ncbi:MAG: glycosyltransferase [Nanoarchaeota archaeon]|nr:glycosyltransferase [Nanoarchaeota archaeon]
MVILTYNKGKTIFEAITKTEKLASNIVVVDDGSQDNTAIEAAKARATAVKIEALL